MRIALLSDIHANLAALRAALDVAERQGADLVFVAGDVVGDGPEPVEVVAALRERGIESIRGNVDRKVLSQGDSRRKLEKAIREKGDAGRNRAWTALRLLDAPHERAWLAALPEQRTLEVEGRAILVVHGSPWSDTDYVFASLTAPGLDGKLEPLAGWRPDAMACGHSHVPFARRIGGVTVANCGSVGRPADGDPRGSLAVLEVDGAAVRARIVRFEYDVEATIAEIERRAVPGLDPGQYRRGLKR